MTTDCADHSGPCAVNHISCTQNIYDKLDELDLGKTPIAATSMRVKFKSSQSIHWAAREADADFNELDNDLTKCLDINQESFDWAYGMANDKARSNYET